MTQRILTYDIEIKRAIQGRNEARIPGLQYCMGWNDHKNMGIAVICLHDSLSGITHTLMPEEDASDAQTLHELLRMADYIVGFNSTTFDNKVLAAGGYTVPEKKSYDIFVHVKSASGADKYAKGYGLDAIADANGLGRKTEGMHGSMAPALYQSGKSEDFTKLCNYCRQDVHLTVQLLVAIMSGTLRDPINGKLLAVRTPLEVLGIVQTGLI